MKLGRAFRMARSRAGLRQNELAQALDVSPTYISMLENDRRDPSWSFICRACDTLALPVPMLLLLAAEANGMLKPSSGRTAVQAALMELLSATAEEGAG